MLTDKLFTGLRILRSFSFVLFVLINSAFADSEETKSPAEPAALEATESSVYKAQVLFREKPIFALFGQMQNQEAIRDRARRASQALETALTSNELGAPEARDVEISIQKNVMTLKVRGYSVMTIDKEETLLAGYESLEDYKASLESLLESFVKEQRHQIRIQNIASQFFLSIFIALLAFVAFRQVSRLFNRADHVLDERRETLQPVSVLSEPLISGQTMGALLAFSLGIGRILTYVTVVLAGIFAIFGQFDYTRGLLAQFFSDLAAQLLNSVQSLFEFIPGLLLALILIVVLQVGYKILDLFLKGITSGRIRWNVITEHRVAVVRFWMGLAALVVVGPLIVASLFGRFHTPLENILLFVGVAILLAALPVLLNFATGSYLIWQERLHAGQDIELGDFRGHIVKVGLDSVALRSPAGDIFNIPPVLFLVRGFREIPEAKSQALQVELLMKESPSALQPKLQQLFPKEWNVTVELKSITSGTALFAIFVHSTVENWRSQALEILADASLKNQLSLTDHHIQADFS